MSVKYTFLKGICRMLHMQSVMAILLVKEAKTGYQRMIDYLKDKIAILRIVEIEKCMRKGKL